MFKYSEIPITHNNKFNFHFVKIVSKSGEKEREYFAAIVMQIFVLLLLDITMLDILKYSV